MAPKDSELSVYTRYLVKGIEKGSADRDNDGWISVDELPEYAKGKVQEAAPAMKPEYYIVKEGLKINVSKAPVGNPKVRYWKEVEYHVKQGKGDISALGRSNLKALQAKLEISQGEAKAIESQVLAPWTTRKQKLNDYEEALKNAVRSHRTLNAHELKRLQETLAIEDEDAKPIDEKYRRHFPAQSIHYPNPNPPPKPRSSNRVSLFIRRFVAFFLVCVGFVLILYYFTEPYVDLSALVFGVVLAVLGIILWLWR